MFKVCSTAVLQLASCSALTSLSSPTLRSAAMRLHTGCSSGLDPFPSPSPRGLDSPVPPHQALPVQRGNPSPGLPTILLRTLLSLQVKSTRPRFLPPVSTAAVEPLLTGVQ